MENKNLLTKVRTDAKTIMGKLKTYRGTNDIKNYKTSVDSLQILIDINQKNTVKERFNSTDAGKTYHRSTLHHGTDAMDFYGEFTLSLYDEIVLIGLEMDKYLKSGDARTYRDLLISYDKLTRTFQLLDVEFKESIVNIERNNLA